MPIPTFTSSRIGTVPILTKTTSAFFDTLPPTEQQDFITRLEAFQTEIEAKGSDTEFLKDIGVSVDTLGINVAQAKAGVLDMCHWQLATCFRYSNPTRIAEAVPYLEKVIAHFDSYHTNGEVDVTPVMYLAVALHKQAGQEAAAVRHFEAAYAYAPAIGMQLNTQLWSRACFSRLLRRMGRTAEAQEQEDAIRNWLLFHPYGMPPSTFRALVTDPLHEGKDYILDDPSVENMFAGMTEIAPGLVLHIG